MKLKYEKRLFINKKYWKNRNNNLKSTSMNNLLMLTKIKKNNLNKTQPINSKLIVDKSYLEKRNILSNNEKHSKNKNCNQSFNSRKNKICEICDNSYLKSYYLSRIRKQKNNKEKIFGNSISKINNNNNFLQNNKSNLDYYEIYLKNNLSESSRQYLNNIKDNSSIKSINDFNNIFDKNICLLKSSKNNFTILETNQRKKNTKKNMKKIYKDENEDGLFYDLNYHNNSARYENNLEMFIGNSFNSIEDSHKNTKKNKFNNILHYTNILNQFKENKYFNNLKIEKNMMYIQGKNKRETEINNDTIKRMKNSDYGSIFKISKINFFIKRDDKINKKENLESDIIQVFTNNDIKKIENLKEKKDLTLSENSIVQKENYILDNLNLFSLKNELEKLKDENYNIKEEKESLIVQNKLLQEQNNKNEMELNNIKKENERINYQCNSMNSELSKLKEDIKRISEELIVIKKENEKYKEKEIQNIQEKNNSIQIQHIKLNEQIKTINEKKQTKEDSEKNEHNNKIIEEKNYSEEKEQLKNNQNQNNISNYNKIETQLEDESSQNNSYQNEINKDNKKDENVPFNNIIELLQNKEAKIINKKKMKKIIFEE